MRTKLDKKKKRGRADGLSVKPWQGLKRRIDPRKRWWLDA